MYAGLYKKLEDGSVVPDLAAGEPEVSEDGLTYTIKLKDGLVWSDGKPITAHDFVFGINRNLTYGAENGFVTDKMVRYLEAQKSIWQIQRWIWRPSPLPVWRLWMIQRWCII